jgi:UDP-2,3-diacylglucosamine pyrophosphatase LpxH
MTDRPHYKTIVISDVHLGAPFSKVEEVSRFLSSVDCDRLIMDGDIIDGWQLKNSGDEKWTSKQSNFFRVLLDLVERCNTDIIYIVGNHDDFLYRIAPVKMFGMQILNEYILDDGAYKFVVIHGHAFDSITSRLTFIAKLGDWAYNALIRFNNIWNRTRMRQGKPYYSLSQVVKQKVKEAVSALSGFEKDLESYARARHCNGIICGHIHHPEDKMLHEIRYLNSGDWVESMTALAEDMTGTWRILRYTDMVSSNSEFR